ncbi:glyoxalase I [Trichodelitschia bisporula]|uniref:Lactoylglutathione lyase n=1 Tax=Trichodelitschia bisporula TaxID=703511 RepID=A0A6G1HSB2_9PEZI|nr:glyoxalase I [Trichodelitschia bisporula]
MATDPSTYKFNHTMLRVKDPQRSLKFYEFFGLKFVNKMPGGNFDIYFLAYDSGESSPVFLELTHNHGTENDPDYQIVNGNTEPFRGFGHIAISVDNIQAACQRLEDAGYPFQKKLTDGRMKHIAFVKDPDSYWVEIIPQNPLEETASIRETDPSTYRLNHTMIRVKDAEKSIAFYQDVLGMQLKRSSQGSDFTLYFLGYGPPTPDKSPNGVNPLADREGLLELTWNHGTEKDADFKYHDGNAQPQGFGHICVTVDNIETACARFDEKKVSFKKRLTDGKMKNIAFILDPDGYWVEIVAHDVMSGITGR